MIKGGRGREGRGQPSHVRDPGSQPGTHCGEGRGDWSKCWSGRQSPSGFPAGFWARGAVWWGWRGGACSWLCLHREGRLGPCPTALRPPARATTSSRCSHAHARRRGSQPAPTATPPCPWRMRTAAATTTSASVSGARGGAGHAAPPARGSGRTTRRRAVGGC